MDDWKFLEDALGNWQYLQLSKSIIPENNLQGVKMNVEWTFSVGDTMLQFYN